MFACGVRGTPVGAWSVAIIDTGIVDEFEATHGANTYEWDFYYRDGSTDGGRTFSHGTYVAQTIEQTNPALERIDLQVSSNSGSFVSLAAADSALNRLIALHDQGWNIGAINMSWGSTLSYSAYVPEINALAARGIYGVAAVGNGGTAARFENVWYPAGLNNVIAVGSHDGAGNPSSFSQNNPGAIHVLADGEDVPRTGLDGTSFAAPQVAAGVATVQALADAALERRLSFAETVGVLQQGGGARLSNPDPADGKTRYYLFDHDGSVNHFLRRHLDPEFSAYEYMASYEDIASAFAGNPAAARSHLISIGVYEGREVGFDGLEYIASYEDLMGAFGTSREAGALHYLSAGQAEGRSVGFDAAAYLGRYADLRAAFGNDTAAAARHYITAGHHEGRTDGSPRAGAALGTDGAAPDPVDPAWPGAWSTSADGLL